MSLSDLASLGSFVSGIAVLISLIYLAVQVRQAERNQKAQIQQGRAARMVDLQLRLADPANAELVSRGLSGEEFESEKDFRRFRAIIRRVDECVAVEIAAQGRWIAAASALHIASA